MGNFSNPVSNSFISPRPVSEFGGEVVQELEVVIEDIKIRGAAARTLEKAAVARGVHVKQVLADIIHYVLEDDMIDAVLDDR